MMQRLLELRIPIYSVLYDDKLTKSTDRSYLDIKDCHWQVMEHIVPILKPFADATEILAKEDLPTASSTYILVQNLVREYLSVTDLDTGISRDLKNAIKEGIVKRFKLDEDGFPFDAMLDSPLVKAAVLDPRYKQLKFLKPEQKEIVHQKIIELMESESQSVVTVKTESGEPEDSSMAPPEKKSKFMFDCLLGDICDLTTPTSAEKEFQDYISEPVRIANPLKWWEASENRYPNVAKLAKSYLSIPGTSVPSERTFSVAGMTLTKLRSNLDPDTLDEIIFINKNMKEQLMLQMSHHLVQDASVTPATETVLSQGTGENCQTSHENQNASEEFKINVKSECSNSESVSQKQQSLQSGLPKLPSLDF